MGVIIKCCCQMNERLEKDNKRIKLGGGVFSESKRKSDLPRS